MIPLKLWLASFHGHRQLAFKGLSLSFIIIIAICYIIPIPDHLAISLEFIPFIILVIWFELWFFVLGKVWILFSTILIVYSHVNPLRGSAPFIIVYIIFLIITMYLIHQKEKKERAFHHRQLNTMKALLRENPPSIQTVDYSHEAVLLLDNLGAIIESNPQSSYLLSLPESCLVGKPIYDVLGILPNFQPDDVPENGDFTWKTYTGITKQLKFRTRSMLNHDTPCGTLVTLFDISDAKKRMENSLQIEKLSIISQVSAGLASEIRNPLTTIKGFMQLISPEQWPESFRPYQQLILDEIQTIDGLVNNFILITNPSAPQMDRLNLLEAIPLMTESIKSMAQIKDIKVVHEFPAHPVYMMADREQLLQALLSILNNAIEVSPKSESIIISISEKEAYVRINIIDNGPGIPENLHHRVLDPFFTTRNESIGLGLTIAHQIILTHHGKLSFSESSISGGTKVSIDFPSLSGFTDNLSA